MMFVGTSSSLSLLVTQALGGGGTVAGEGVTRGKKRRTGVEEEGHFSDLPSPLSPGPFYLAGRRGGQGNKCPRGAAWIKIHQISRNLHLHSCQY